MPFFPFAIALSVLASLAFAGSNATILPPLGASAALDSSAPFRVDSIEFQAHNAFDDVEKHTDAERFTYRLLNKIHFTTHEEVIRKLILFDKGDTVTLRQLIESERVLRSQKIFATARIDSRIGENGEHILRIETSDNWTTTVPLSLSFPGGKLLYQVGLLESNVLGYGQSVGVFVAREEERYSYMLRYGNPHFLIANNKLVADYARTSDGHVGDFQLTRPFLSRLRDEWAYTVEGTTQQLSVARYWSSPDLPPRRFLDSSQVPEHLDSKGKAIAYPEFSPGSSVNKLLILQGQREDSLSLRLGRSFGDGIKWYLRGTYDYHRIDWPQVASSLRYPVYAEGSRFWTLDTTLASSFLTPRGDSRFGAMVSASRIRYARMRNFHRIKWTEDVDKGWSVSAQATKNLLGLGAIDNRWFCNGAVTIAFGGEGSQHLVLKSYLESWVNDTSGHMQDIYGRVNGEYIWRASERFSTALSGLVDGYSRAPLGQQLTLGGIEGLNGLPSFLLAGQGRYLAKLEQRWFPQVEFATMVPVFTGYVNVGQTYASIRAFEPRDLQVMAGIGLRVGMSKSVDGVVNHFNLAWPVHGPADQAIMPRVSWLADVSL